MAACFDIRSGEADGLRESPPPRFRRKVFVHHRPTLHLVAFGERQFRDVSLAVADEGDDEGWDTKYRLTQEILDSTAQMPHDSRSGSSIEVSRKYTYLEILWTVFGKPEGEEISFPPSFRLPHFSDR